MDAVPWRPGVAVRSVRTSCPDSRAKHPCFACRDPRPPGYGSLRLVLPCSASVAGVSAGGDCTTVPYKQVVIAMGGGSRTSPVAFESLDRGPSVRVAPVEGECDQQRARNPQPDSPWRPHEHAASTEVYGCLTGESRAQGDSAVRGPSNAPSTAQRGPFDDQTSRCGWRGASWNLRRAVESVTASGRAGNRSVAASVVVSRALAAGHREKQNMDVLRASHGSMPAPWVKPSPADRARRPCRSRTRSVIPRRPRIEQKKTRQLGELPGHVGAG
jgi:hypothetical protein